MSFKAWSPGLSVGIGAIDADHKAFFGILEELSQLFREAPRAGQVHDLFAKLEREVMEHFKREEDLMQRYKYPDLEHHHQLHSQFKAVIRGLRKSYDHGSEQTRLELFEALDAWAYHHIAQDDKAYALYLQEQNVMLTPISTKAPVHPRTPRAGVVKPLHAPPR